MPQQSFHLSLKQQLAQQVVEDVIAISRDLSPTSSTQVDPCSAVLINGPCSLDKHMVQPPGFDYSLAGPHLASDATFPNCSWQPNTGCCRRTPRYRPNVHPRGRRSPDDTRRFSRRKKHSQWKIADLRGNCTSNIYR